MSKIVGFSFLFATLWGGIFCPPLGAQVAPTGRVSGTVTDPTGAVIPGADVTVKNTLTGIEFKAVTNAEGYFLIPALPIGEYAITVRAPGFKRTTLTAVKVEAATPLTTTITLEPGELTEEITVTGGGGELLNKTTQTVSTTIVGRQIVELPFTSRDALDLVLNLPGTVTPGRPRTSSINGLPKGSLNITLDGVNVQDNFLKTSDGFFTYIRPRIDAIEEVSVTTATPGAESAGEGAVQIKFVTKSGTNEFHGGVYWYHRNPVLNANYYFNNLSGLPRNRLLLNQYGVKVGGPILKNRAFFFVNYEEFRLPESRSKDVILLTPEAERGIFRYPGGPPQGVNLLELAAQAGFVSTPDPTIQKILAAMRDATQRGTTQAISGDPNRLLFRFQNFGNQTRRFPTLRVDFNITEKHHLENIYNYQDFASNIDFLNNLDPNFPGPLLGQFKGSQDSNRFSNVIGLRSTLTSHLVNEFRFGLTGGTVVFAPEIGGSLFQAFGGTALDFPLITDPQSTSSSSRRNTPVYQIYDNLYYMRGRHNINFGFSFTHIGSWSSSSGGVIPTTSFGIASTDPVNQIFTAEKFPGASSVIFDQARSLYALLTGLITSVSAQVNLDEKTKRYVVGAPFVERNRQREFGIYGQDSWRISPSLTLNYGLRWEVQLPFVHTNEIYTTAGPLGVWGVSGPGNLFRPGVLTGTPPVFVFAQRTTQPYQTDGNNLAPSVGLSWSPSVIRGPGLVRSIFGGQGKSVFRAGYSISYTREGLFSPVAMWSFNPGGFLNVTRSVARGNLSPQTYLRSGLPDLKPEKEAPEIPIRVQFGDSVNEFDPKLRTPYVQSWVLGWQREILPEMVVEVRYVGNRGVKLWRQIALNEVNIFENGFLQEFIQAQKNLEINRQRGRGNTFQNFNLPGQAPLPIFQASFGSAAARLFRDLRFISRLDQGQAGGVANILANDVTFHQNRLAAGLPPNLFLVNPDVIGGGDSFYWTNGADSWYNALQIELRRRMSKGLLVQASYVFSKSQSDFFASNAFVFQQYRTLRNTRLNKGLSPWDAAHAIKANWIWELPFGPGQRWSPAHALARKLSEGWAFHGIARIQSGTPVLLTSGRFTFNGGVTVPDAGVLLVNLTQKDLERMVKIRKAPDGTVFWLPENLLINTQRAFGLRPGETPDPNQPYLAPPTKPGELGGFIFLHGPWFRRFDLSLVKKTRLSESANIEFRAEFLNAFNEANFLIGSPAADVVVTGVDSLTFGQTTNAYRDLSTTNDPGGRLIQFVLRINF